MQEKIKTNINVLLSKVKKILLEWAMGVNIKWVTDYGEDDQIHHGITHEP